MSDSEQGSRTQMHRLRRALDQNKDQPLTHAEVQTLLPAFVQAEAAEQDVDDNPTYQPLLRHLERCEGCAALYAELTDDVAAIVDLRAKMPVVSQAPVFFPPKAVRETDRFVLRVRDGIVRTIELLVMSITPTPRMETLSGTEHQTVFSDRIAELGGAPLFAVSVRLQNETSVVHVAVRDGQQQNIWRVRLALRSSAIEHDTNAQGIAEFRDVAVAELQTVTITCTELTQRR